jgi:hypothetical protein
MIIDQAMVPTLAAAERLGVDVIEVYRMIDEGRLTPAWNRERLVVPVAEVDAIANSTR